MYLDKEEIKFATLYTIKQYKAPISMSRIYEILTWEKGVMDYFDLSEALMELTEDGYILNKYYRNEEAYSLTEMGSDTHNFFKDRIPYGIRLKIDAAIGKLRFDEVSDPNAVRAEVVPINNFQYGVRFSVLDSKTEMLTMTLNTGTKLRAELTAEYMNENAKTVYEKIVEICMMNGNERKEG